MDEIGPWAEEIRQPPAKVLEPVKTYKFAKVRGGGRLWERKRKVKESRVPQSVQISPVSFRSPEFRLFVPAHTWKPMTPANLRPKVSIPDHFSLLITKSTRPLSAAHISFDITTAKKTLEKLSRAGTKSPPHRDISSFSQPNSGPLLKLTPILEGGRGGMGRSPAGNRAVAGPSRQYKRRVKDLNIGKLSYPDYDQLAENLTEKFAVLWTKRPKTSQIRHKSPQREANKEDLRATLSQIVS